MHTWTCTYTYRYVGLQGLGVRPGSAYSWSSANTTWFVGDVVVEEGVAAGHGDIAFLIWLRGIYFTFGTFMVIVIGDIVPVTLIETLWVLVLIFVGASINSFVIGLIVGVIAHVDEDEHEQAAFRSSVEDIMESYGVPSPLQQRVFRFLTASHERGAVQERNVLRKLPPPLQMEAAKRMRFDCL